VRGKLTLQVLMLGCLFLLIVPRKAQAQSTVSYVLLDRSGGGTCQGTVPPGSSIR